ncbi:MAG: ABC transporter ATP-binding protein [Spirochaetales bacterium]|nr:ABC transporter ATP-binding protein [Spirochaetales bacterium]
MFRAYKNFFEFSKQHIKNWRKGIIFEIIRCIFESLQFLALMVAFRAILEHRPAGSAALSVFVIMLVSVVGATIMWKLAHHQEAVASYRSCEVRRMGIGERMKYMPMGFFNSRRLGDITAAATSTMETIEAIAFATIVRTLVGIINAVVLSLCALYFDWRIGLIFLAGVVIFMLINSILMKKSRKSSPVRLEAQTALIDASLEYVQGMSVIKSFHMVANANKSINRTIEETGRQNLKTERIRIPYIAVEDIVLSLASVGVVLTSVILYFNGVLPLLTAVLLIVSTFMVYIQLEVAGKMFFMLPMADALIEQVYDVGRSPLMDVDGENISPENLDIELDNVSFSYESRRILNKLSMKIPEGTTTAIVGPSGGGKTTVCNLIARFWDVDDGSIRLGGHNLKDYSLDSLLANISMVFQSVYLFNDTIENNIKFGNPEAGHEDVVNAAKRACAHEFIEALPEGYDTIVGESGGTISGGEKQRVSIARAILKDAPIIILDEATANVDPENENDLMRAFENLTKGRTVIMIAHRLKTVRKADQIIVLDKGQIVQQGRHDDLVEKEGIYADFIARRSRTISWKINQSV